MASACRAGAQEVSAPPTQSAGGRQKFCTEGTPTEVGPEAELSAC